MFLINQQIQYLRLKVMHLNKDVNIFKALRSIQIKLKDTNVISLMIC
jgi:hypothetical protein